MIKKYNQYIKEKMEVFIGDKGLDKTYQDNFPKETECCHSECKGNARIGFVSRENDSPYLADLYENGKDNKKWLHDACAVAIYFCEECLNPSALYNQA